MAVPSDDDASGLWGPTLALAALTPLVRGLDHCGLDGQRLLRGFGIDEADLQVPHRRVPLAAVRGIWQVAAREAADPLFGLTTGLAAGRAEAPWLAGLDPTCCDPTTAARTCCQVFNDLASCMHSHLVETEGEVRFVKEPCGGALVPEDLRHATDFVVSAAYSFSRRFDLHSSHWAVFLPHPAVAPPGQIEELLGCEVAFEQPAAGFLLRTQGSEAAPPDAHLHPFARRVSELLSQQLDRGQPLSLALVARPLGLSPRTLQRRLADLGTSYQALIDGVRASHARALLDSSTNTVLQISESLGFAEPVAFRRAFRRWTGVTPRDFRGRGTNRDSRLS
jgi:AraC-like DNA-binding protein